MAVSKYTFALGQMPPDVEGRRAQALILMHDQEHREIAHIPYDAAAEVLIAALNLVYLAKPD